MNLNSAHGIVAVSMIITGLTVALAQDWIGNVRAWILTKTTGQQQESHAATVTPATGGGNFVP